MSFSSAFPDALHEAARAIFAALTEAKRVLVTSEPSPDGDAFGAEIALWHLVQHAWSRNGETDKAGEREIYLVNERGCPEAYRFLPGAERLIDLERFCELGAPRCDVAVVVDGGIERTGALEPYVRASERTILIDHHRYGSAARYDLELVDPAASSTTQLLWVFVEDREIALPLDQELAAAIYLGIIFDTGSFQFPLTQPLSHRIAARIMETGLDVATIHERALLETRFEAVKLIGLGLERAARSPSGRVVWSWIEKADLERFGANAEEGGRLIQMLSFTVGTEAAVVFRQQSAEIWKVSLRSRGRVDVACIARQLDPGGGGHDRAAGCTLHGSLASVRKRTLDALEAALDAR